MGRGYYSKPFLFLFLCIYEYITCDDYVLMSKYQHIYNSISDVILIHRANSGEIVFVNDKCQGVYGYTQEEIIEKGFALLLIDDDVDYNMEAVAIYLTRFMQ